MNPAVATHESDLSPLRPEITQFLEANDQSGHVNIRSAVADYMIQWLAYLLIAGGALFIGPSLGTTISEMVHRRWDASEGLSLATTFEFFALAPDQAFASLAVLVVVILTLSAGFRNGEVDVEPEATYVRYRVQAWLLALTGICCNAIALMLLVYTVQNWGSTDEMFQAALLPLAFLTSVAASLLSVGRERQMHLESMMLLRGIVKLERQHRKANERWENRWGAITEKAPTLPSFGWVIFVGFCAITYVQLVILTIFSIIGDGKSFPLLLAPLSVAYFCIFPVLAVMTIVTNIFRGMDVMDRFSQIFLSSIYLLSVASTVSSIFGNEQWPRYMPHLAFPALAGITLILPLLLVSFRADPKRHPDNAFFAPQRYQRALELRAELRRRDMIEKRLEALRSDWRRRSSVHGTSGRQGRPFC